MRDSAEAPPPPMSLGNNMRIVSQIVLVSMIADDI